MVDIPVVDVDDLPDAPGAMARPAKAAFKAPPPAHVLAKMPLLLPPVQLAQGGAAAAADAASPRPAEVPLPTAAQAFERASAVLRAREAELRASERQLAVSMAASSEGWAEVRRLELFNAGWRRQQKEQEARDATRDVELRELARFLAECRANLALAEAMLERASSSAEVFRYAHRLPQQMADS